MNSKIRQLFTFFIVLAIPVFLIASLYFLIGYPRSYPPDKAIKNGYVVSGAGRENKERFYEFIENVKQKTPDSIRIAAYTKEGQLTFIDLAFDTTILTYQSKERKIFGERNYGEYTSILKKENHTLIDYYLIDENGHYADQWIYQDE